ncbi:MAG TPA: FlgD immunoglobulin-like domain containing protein [candidate division Zixibacteria bacterium]
MVKAGVVAFSFFVFLFCFLLPLFVISKAEFLPPSYLTAQSDQDGKVPLYWFSPSPDTLEINYYKGGMLCGMNMSPAWHENCVGVRMTSLSFPFYLLESQIYISHYSVAGDTDYNYHAPFFVTVNQDSAGIPKNVFLDSVSASAQGTDSLSEGEWVDIKNHLLMTDSVFWIVVHWNEDTPGSPCVGVDSFTNVGNSFCGKRLFLYFEWYPYDYNFMIKTEVVTNPKKGSEANRFRVYRSLDSNSIIAPTNLIASLPTSRFQFTDSGVAVEQRYFYQLTSYASSLESPGSNIESAIPKKKAMLNADRNRYFVLLNSEENINDNLILTNTGGLPLWYESRIDMKETDGIGGSDQSGYTWSDNRDQSDLSFAWTDIETLGTPIGNAGDYKKNYGFFHLDFPFPFYGNTYDSISVTSNGWLSFSDVVPCSTDTFKWWINQNLPRLWGPYALVAPFWDFFELTDSSTVYFYSTSDSAVVSFLNLHYYSHPNRGPYTFQTILTPDGELSFQYLKIDDSLYSATVGIQNEDGTTGLEISYNQNYLQDSLTVKIRPAWVRIDSLEGCIPPGESKTLDLKFDPLSYPKGVYQADLVIDSWDKNHQLYPLLIPLTLCIDTIIDSTTSVPWKESERPEKITLFQNYPNPFNPLTRIRYVVAGWGKATDDGRWSADGFSFPTTLIIYNILGQKIRTLVDEPQKPGNYEVIWDGKDEQGNDVASGIYFCKLTIGSFQKTQKMILLK